MAGQPLLQLLLVDQAADSIPKPGTQHGAQQACQHDWKQLQLSLLDQKASQRHHHLRWNRRHHVFQQHN
jgi:hypothetical protein